ncbi:MAG: hypothetical protein IJO79_06970 [Firmicutes bacterium]|nr:hypothetical protein [Bacillota bacterium]
MKSNKDFYKETFSQIRSASEIRWEDMPKTQPGGTRRPRRVLILAAAICLLAAFSIAAYASDLFGLRDMEMMEDVPVQQPDGQDVIVEVPTGMISLQGYGEMPEKLASVEWEKFILQYRETGALDHLGNEPTGLEAEYGLYQVYTPEMAEKFDEILTKYDLKKHTWMVNGVLDNEKLCAQVGGNFLGENQAYSAYMYEDGTFKFDGELYLADYGLLDYQFMRCVKGSFNEALLNIGNSLGYAQWPYTTADGTPVTLALSESKGLVIVDLPDSFVTINVLTGTEAPVDDIFSSGPITQSHLERFADSFDFPLLTPVQAPVQTEPDPAPWEAPEDETFLQGAGVTMEAAQAYFAQFLALLEADDRQAVAEMLNYPGVVRHWKDVAGSYFLVENTVVGPEEFLPYYEEIFTEGLRMRILENQYTEEWSDLFTHGGMIGAAGGDIWFAAAEEGFRIMTIQNPEDNSFR